MKNRNLRTNIKIGVWTAAFALAAAIGFGGCTNASESSGGSGDAGGNGSAGETNFTIKTVGGDTVLTGYEGEKPRGNIILPSGITKIGEGAFKDCTGLTGTLDLSAYSKLTSIGYNAFYKCSGLTGLVLPENLTIIDINAFSECTSLTGELKLPEKLTAIRDYAFNNCSGFTGTLILPENLTAIGNKAFMECKGFTSVKIRGNDTTIGVRAFSLKNDIPFIVKSDAVKDSLTGSQSGIVDEQITVDSSI